MSKLKRRKLSKRSVIIIIIVVMIIGAYLLAIFAWPEKAQSPTKDQIQPSASENTTNAKVSSSQAAELVRQFLDAKRSIIVEYDAESGDGRAWIIHVYEIVDNHTATYGWYKVDKQSGQITDCTIEGCS